MLDFRKILACLILATIPASLFNLVMHFYSEGTISIIVISFLALRVLILKYCFPDVVADIFKNIRKNYFK